MRILGRYVFREIFAGSVLAVILSTFIIFLRGSGQLFQLLVTSSARGLVVLELVALSLPNVLLLSIPFGVLVGILVGLGRMSGDNEIVALRSAGVSSRVVVAPVLLFAFLATLASAACTLWLNPLAIRNYYRLGNKLAAAQITANVERGVFQEQFTNENTVLYVDNVIAGTGPTQWQGVFIADLTPPSERTSPLKEKPTGPRITMAQTATAIPDQEHNRIVLHMTNESVHESPYHSLAASGDTALAQTQQQQQTAKKAVSDMTTPELRRYLRTLKQGAQDWIDASIEWHRRLALPVACLMLALVGIPLGVSSRRGGKSSGYVWAIFISFFCYYLAYIALTNMARSHAIGTGLASWLPNICFCVIGLVMILRMEAPGDRDITGNLRLAVNGWLAGLSGQLPVKRAEEHRGFRIVLLQIVDNYVLSGFLFYFVVWISAFVAMTQVYTFFELLGDVVKNHISMERAATYHLYLTPKLIYDTLPFGVLLAVLVTFGIMTKNNEVTAFKACGISVRRLGIPVILMSGVLSAAAFAADFSWIPRANQIQDSIRNEIKGRPVQTYLHPERKWVIHEHRVFYFRYFDAAENVMVDPWVYEVDPKTFRLTKQINARSARWQPNAKAWIFEQGEAIDLCGVVECKDDKFTATSFPELTEVPGDFLKDLKQDQQMNYLELDRYIKDLRKSGFDTIRLQVQYYRKFTTPLFALTMALISVPFGFLVGNRGAMAGIGVSIALAMAYLGVGQLFEQMGNVRYLPPAMAAWAPDTLFSLTGLYLILRMRS